MSRQNIASNCITTILFWLLFATTASASVITDFNSWTQVQDPPHTGMTGNIDTPNLITLTASSPVPVQVGTDIAYQSVNGSDVPSSSLGNYFLTSRDFHIAVDFSLSNQLSGGIAAVGFGVGEDSAGANSAGVLLAIQNGSLPAYTGGARIDDSSQTPLFLGLSPATSGRFFVRYDSISGDIILGLNASPGSELPSNTVTFSGLQNDWNDAPLLASFFLRSDLIPLTGTVNTVFSNFVVLEGTPVSVVPLPAAAWLFGSGFIGLIGIAGRNART